MPLLQESQTMQAVTFGWLTDALGSLAVSPVDPAARSVTVTGIAIDSRLVRGGELFVAVRGVHSDGHAFVADALARGAAAIIAEHGPVPFGIPFVLVDDAAKSLALVAARFHGDAARDLRLCGITGTNGKTSSAHIVREILRGDGRRTGLIGTLGHGVDRLVKDPHTTPDALTLHSLFADMKSDGCVGVVMEVSSHAVRQHRTWGLDFEVGILTNVTHDHLDYHPTMADYKAAKAEFCYSLAGAHRNKPDGTLVYWREDANAREIGDAFAGRRIAVGTSEGCDWRVRDIDISLDATRFALTLPSGERLDVAMKLLGGFVPANAAVSAAAAAAMGVSPARIQAGLESIGHVPGRFEALGGGSRPVVIIDYAHTPDGFERVLATCRSLRPRKLVTVFGCGGDRDRAKRPVMGGIAQRASDRCYLTTDNPRGENAADIVEDILGGMQRTSSAVVDLDRARAIRSALAECVAGDIVAILGKGAEEYQQVGSESLPWSDRAQAEEALSQWRAR